MKKGEGHFSSKKGSGGVRRGQARSGAVRRFLRRIEARPVLLARRHGVAGGAAAVGAIQSDRGEADEEVVLVYARKFPKISMSTPDSH